jgi:ketosteroid isomerase-like protein
MARRQNTVRSVSLHTGVSRRGTIVPWTPTPDSTGQALGCIRSPRAAQFPLSLNIGKTTMSTEDNKQIVREFCDHFRTSNVDGLIDAMTEDATWWVNGKPNLFSSAGTKTKAEAASMFRNMFSAYTTGLDMKIINMVGEGDSVAAEARSRATTKLGKIYENEYFFLFKIRDGKIAIVREYTDLMYVQETFG